MTFTKLGDASGAVGLNWSYGRFGRQYNFKQFGKVKSLRKVKTFIKVCNKLSEGENRISFVEEE